jgi:transposase InsO family protein
MERRKFTREFKLEAVAPDQNRGVSSLRSQQPIYQRAVPAAHGRQPRRLLDGRSGNVWDNAAMESFFSSLKTERTARRLYRTRDEANADVSITSSASTIRNAGTRELGYRSPMEFERQAGLA